MSETKVQPSDLVSSDDEGSVATVTAGEPSRLQAASFASPGRNARITMADVLAYKALMDEHTAATQAHIAATQKFIDTMDTYITTTRTTQESMSAKVKAVEKSVQNLATAFGSFEENITKKLDESFDRVIETLRMGLGMQYDAVKEGTSQDVLQPSASNDLSSV